MEHLIETNGTSIVKYTELEDQAITVFQLIDDIVLKNYITKLEDLDVIPLDEAILETNISENVRFFKITEMVYQKDEYATYKFASVFNSVSDLECSVFVIIDSDGEKTDFYMGIRSLNSNRTTSSLENTLNNALKGQFPGIKSENLLDEDMKTFLSGIKGHSIASVTSVAQNKDDSIKDNKTFLQGLEKLAISMQGEKYTGIIIANGTSANQLLETRKAYENLYTQLSPFATTQIGYASNNACSVSQSISTGISNGTAYSENKSNTTGTSYSKSESSSNSTSKVDNLSKSVKALGVVAGVVGVALATVTGGASLLMTSSAAAGISLLGSAIQKTETNGTSKSYSKSETSSETKGKSFSTNASKTRSDTHTKGLTRGTSQNMQLTMQNKSIINTLERIDLQLKRLQECESLGMWECAAYFLSGNQHASEIAAATYMALMRGENSGIEVSAVNRWSKLDSKKTKLIEQYIINFIHPVFAYNSPTQNIQVTPCTLVSGNELAVHMGLPRKSISGFPVIEHADFGKEVVQYFVDNNNQKINLVYLFNMGSECKNSVKLNRNSLSMHTFVTGATGSGKSNTVYEILDQLNSVDIKFLVIEPAKGEYKNIFGNRFNVKVLGTNPKYSEILRINPFQFPPKVHVLEHVDRLIEIFNVCWPMYAAMPAVLKDAVLKAYQVCGWNLVDSVNQFSNNVFPTFEDLQTELINVIEESAYSQELKSNYIGSLATRVKSLTNGLNGQIFSSSETDNEILFDRNVIVDLSRVGSLETKALLMGILIMRLNEHRMSYSNGMNLQLRHVTVLEEAHNILKRTSTDHSSEGSNLMGKSVEMLSNAIAEMRTYGEGFIIADQSPSAVDMSAIRNTNTKIIMRLPDEEDRRLAGKSANLKEDQLDEIGKLPKGVAVVYQNDWLEPVLCKVSKFDGDEVPYQYQQAMDSINNKDVQFKSELLKLLLKGRIEPNVEINIEDIENGLNYASMSTKNKIGVHFLIKEYNATRKLKVWKIENFDKLAELVTELLNAKYIIINYVTNAINYTDLTIELRNFVINRTIGLNDEMILAIIHCMMKEVSKESEDRFEIYSAWRSQIEGGCVFI